MLCALACLATLPCAAAATPASSADGVLQELGWRIDNAAEHDVVMHGGEPCRRASLAEAQAAGDLQLQLPRRLAPGQREAALQRALDSDASRCAFAIRIGEAARRATMQLHDNDGYRFTALQLGWIGFGARGAQAQGWERFRSFGRGYRPAGSNSTALDAFYRGHVRSECGVGRQVAQLATLRELFGDAAFDRAFSADELSIGTFLTLHRTDSILLGAHAGTFFADGKAEKTAAMGRQAFMGAPGFIAHVFDRAFLDDANNQAENFIVTDVSEEAAEALAAHGGLRHYDAVNREIWALSRRIEVRGLRRFERLLIDGDAALRRRLDAPEREALARMEALLDDPFYRGFVVYVHPMGVKPIGWHVARLLDRNPRTPYAIDLALHNLHTTLYRRWIDSRQHSGVAGSPYATGHGTMH